MRTNRGYFRKDRIREKHEATPDEHSSDIRILEARSAIFSESIKPFETDIIGCWGAGFYNLSVLFTGCEGAAGDLTGKYDREDDLLPASAT